MRERTGGRTRPLKSTFLPLPLGHLYPFPLSIEEYLFLSSFLPILWSFLPRPHRPHPWQGLVCSRQKKKDLSWRDKWLPWQAPDLRRKAFLLYKPSPVAKPLKNTKLADSQAFGVRHLRCCCQLCQVCSSEAGG